MRVFRILASLALLTAVLGLVAGCGGGGSAAPQTSLGNLTIDDVAKVATFSSDSPTGITSIVANFKTNTSTAKAINGDVVFKLTEVTGTSKVWTLQFNTGSTDVPAATGQYVMTVFVIKSDGTRTQAGLGQIVNISGTAGTGDGSGTSVPPDPPWTTT